MPAAQVGYPQVPGSDEAFTFPADFISEAIDQTRGLVLLAAGRSTRWSSARARTATSCAWATSSTPTAARCPSRSATSSTRGRSSTPGAPTPCAGGCSARARPGRRRGPRWAPSTRPCATCCSRCGTPSASSPPTRRSTGSIRPTPPSRRPPSAGRSTAGSSPAWPARRPRSTEALSSYEPLDGGHRPRRAGRRPLQLVRAAQPPPVLAHRSRRAGRATRWPPRPPCTRC